MSSLGERQGRVIHGHRPSSKTRDLKLGCAVGASCLVLIAEPSSFSSHSNLSPRLCPGRGKVLLNARESSPGEGKLPPISSPLTATSVWG